MKDIKNQIETSPNTIAAKSVTGSVHKKCNFNDYIKNSPKPEMIYSRSDLLKMIFKSDKK